jgi:carboxymethylenebutenolidase
VIRSITVPGAGVELSAVEAGDGGANKIPILLIHENRGLVPYMLAEITRFAERGHRVVAPDLLTRVGGTAAHADDPTSISTRVIENDVHVADLAATYDWMAGSEQRLAVVGFCFGAEMGWQLIIHRTPELAVMWYGIGPDPVDAVQIRSRVLATYAQDDPRVNDTLPPLCQALGNSATDITLESFPGTRHAFADHTRPERHHPAAAEEMRRQTFEFLDRA